MFFKESFTQHPRVLQQKNKTEKYAYIIDVVTWTSPTVKSNAKLHIICATVSVSHPLYVQAVNSYVMLFYKKCNINIPTELPFKFFIQKLKKTLLSIPS